MNLDEVKEAYREALGEFETISIRRYSGTAGSRTSTDYECLGHSRGEGSGKELIGSVVQDESKVWALVDDLVAAGVTLPLSTQSDRVVIDGVEKSIRSIDAETVRLKGQTVAFILTVRGGPLAGRSVAVPAGGSPTYYILGF